MRFLIVALSLLFLAGAAHADSTVIARATDQRGGTWVACGGIHAVGWVVYDLVSVVDGPSPGARFVAIHSCPDYRLRGELRLVLSTKKPTFQPRLDDKTLPKDLPRFYALSAKPEAPPETRDARRWLRKPVADVALKPTGKSGEWTEYGPHLALRTDGQRVVAVRVQVALGMTCEEAAAWIGYIAGHGRRFPLRRRPACEWPATSERHRLEPGVEGKLQDGWFEIWLR